MRIEYEEYARNRAKFIKEILTRGGLERLPSRRRRDEEEEDLLTHLDALRWRRLEEEGRIIYLGDRRYRIEI
ncbi:MAG: hypothetical protein QXU06_01840 [Candidatus Bathyarchaeia archaeon]